MPRRHLLPGVSSCFSRAALPASLAGVRLCRWDRHLHPLLPVRHSATNGFPPPALRFLPAVRSTARRHVDAESLYLVGRTGVCIVCLFILNLPQFIATCRVFNSCSLGGTMDWMTFYRFMRGSFHTVQVRMGGHSPMMTTTTRGVATFHSPPLTTRSETAHSRPLRCSLTDYLPSAGA